jgi:DNA-binding NarL/FixJ family response regulator
VEKLHAEHAGHALIGDDQIDREFFQPPQRLVGAGRRQDLHPLISEGAADGIQDARLVVHQEHDRVGGTAVITHSHPKVVEGLRSTYSMRQPTIICVDDDPEILRALGRLFRHEPWDVLLTEHPADVLQWICDREVDLLITDQRMPEMNGTDLLEVVQDYSPETACVILSGFPDTAVIVEQTRLRLERLLSKPWDNGRLLETVRGLMRSEPEAAPPLAEVTVECSGRTGREVIADILPVCTRARAEGTRVIVVLKSLGLLNDSISRLLKGLASVPLPVDLRDESGCVAEFVAALARSSRVR